MHLKVNCMGKHKLNSFTTMKANEDIYDINLFSRGFI